jgi:hypothetical protein
VLNVPDIFNCDCAGSEDHTSSLAYSLFVRYNRKPYLGKESKNAKKPFVYRDFAVTVNFDARSGCED